MLDMSRLPKSRALRGNEENSVEQGPRFDLFWLCLAAGLAAVAALAWLFGLTGWAALIGVLVIGCPVVLAWILLGGVNR